MKATCPWMKNMLFCPQFTPQKAENRILGLWNFKMFWEARPQTPPAPRKKGTNGLLLIQSVTLFKPAGYFNFCGKHLLVYNNNFFYDVLWLGLNIKEFLQFSLVIEAFIFLFNIIKLYTFFQPIVSAINNTISLS